MPAHRFLCSEETIGNMNAQIIQIKDHCQLFLVLVV